MQPKVLITGCWQSIVTLYPPSVLQQDVWVQIDWAWLFTTANQSAAMFTYHASAEFAFQIFKWLTIPAGLSTVRQCLVCSGKGRALEATRTNFCILNNCNRLVGLDELIPCWHWEKRQSSRYCWMIFAKLKWSAGSNVICHMQLFRCKSILSNDTNYEYASNLTFTMMVSWCFSQHFNLIHESNGFKPATNVNVKFGSVQSFQTKHEPSHCLNRSCGSKESRMADMTSEHNRDPWSAVVPSRAQVCSSDRSGIDITFHSWQRWQVSDWMTDLFDPEQRVRCKCETPDSHHDCPSCEFQAWGLNHAGNGLW